MQDTGSASTKTGLARNEQEWISVFTMFRSASFKMFSSLATAATETIEYAGLKKDGKKIPEAQMKRVRGRIIKLAGAVAGAALLEAAVNTIRNAVRGNDDDDEEKNVVAAIAEDTVMNMVGIVPVMGDIVQTIVSGYDIEMMNLDVINEAASSIRSIVSIKEKIIAGEVVDQTKVNRALRDTLFLVSSCTGVPLRNLNGVVKSALNTLKDSRSPELRVTLRYRRSERLRA